MHREDRDFRGGPGEGTAKGRPEDCRDDRDCCEGPSDHADHMARLWEQAFYQALYVLRVEALKTRIKASPFGKNLDVTAKEVVDAMYEEWLEFQAREKEQEKEEKKGASGKERRSLRDLFKDSKTKGPR